MAAPTIRDLLRLYGVRSKRSLSQNFLLDSNVTNRIARAMDGVAGRTVIEVGPGPGLLTRSLLEQGAARVIAVEKDQRFRPFMQTLQEQFGEDRLQPVFADVLDVDERALVADTPGAFLGRGLHILGNLPFAVSTPLLIKWLRQMAMREGIFDGSLLAPHDVRMVLMYQKEVADRLCARPGQDGYTRLTVMTRSYCRPERLFTLSGDTFVPRAKVSATVVGITPKKEPLFAGDVADLERLCRTLFPFRRKMLKRALKIAKINPELPALAGVDNEARPMHVTLEQWAALARAYVELRDAGRLEAQPRAKAGTQADG